MESQDPAVKRQILQSDQERRQRFIWPLVHDEFAWFDVPVEEDLWTGFVKCRLGATAPIWSRMEGFEMANFVC